MKSSCACASQGRHESFQIVRTAFGVEPNLAQASPQVSAQRRANSANKKKNPPSGSPTPAATSKARSSPFANCSKASRYGLGSNVPPGPGKLSKNNSSWAQESRRRASASTGGIGRGGGTPRAAAARASFLAVRTSTILPTSFLLSSL